MYSLDDGEDIGDFIPASTYDRLRELTNIGVAIIGDKYNIRGLVGSAASELTRTFLGDATNKDGFNDETLDTGTLLLCIC